MVGIVDFGDNPSVPKLMEFLRTAFRPRHFDDVEEILIAREKKWNVETEQLKEENDKLRLDKLVAEAELNELKELIVLVDRDRKATQERVRKLLEEVHKRGYGGSEVTELATKITKLEKDKNAAEAAAAFWKNECENLEARVSQLENDAQLLVGLEPPTLNNNRVGLGANGTIPENGDSNFDHVKIEPDVFNSNESTCPVGTPTSHSPKAENDNSHDTGGGEHHEGRVFVEISDSDDDCGMATILPKSQMTSDKSLKNPHSKSININNGSFTQKRKQGLVTENSCTDDNTQPSKQMCLQDLRRGEEQMTAERTSQTHRSPFVLDRRHCDTGDSDSSSTSDSDQSVDEFTYGDVKKIRKWKDEVGLLLAFQKDPELCMDAVCALYRQEILPKSLTRTKHRGFIQSDALRGTELAKFLIDGDQQDKRRKSVEELEEHDKKGIKDCQEIASKFNHYVQLFDIYKNREDPLFP